MIEVRTSCQAVSPRNNNKFVCRIQIIEFLFISTKMEGVNSYIVLSVNGDESVHLIPDLISGSLSNIYVAETCGQKILTNVDLAPQNFGDTLHTNEENSTLWVNGMSSSILSF